MRGTGSPVVLAVFLNIPFNFIVSFVKDFKVSSNGKPIDTGFDLLTTIILDIKSFVILKF